MTGKKKLFKIGFLSAFCFLTLFLFFGKKMALAETIDFEDYTVGNINGQQNWSELAGSGDGFIVSTSYCYGGSGKCLNVSGTVSLGHSYDTTQYINRCFKFRINNTQQEYYRDETPSATSFTATTKLDAGQYKLFINDGYGNLTTVGIVATSTWNEICWYNFYTANPENECRIKLNSGEYIAPAAGYCKSLVDFSRFYISGSGQALYIDDITTDFVTDYIEISFPDDTQSWQSFPNWTINYLIENNSYTSYYAQIFSSSTPQICNLFYTGELTQWSCENSYYFNDGNYSAQALLWGKTGTSLNLLATSLQINFTIDNVTGGTIFDGVSSTMPVYDINSACDSMDQSASTTILWQIECSFRKLIYWAVTPTPAAYYKLSQATNLLKQVFPVNIYYQIRDSFSSLNATTSDDKISFIMWNGSEYASTDIDIISSTTMSSAIGQDNYNKYYSGLVLLENVIGFFIVIFLAFKK